MPELASFQTQFASALAAPGDGCNLARQPGFSVYRNTSAKAALDALRANYPTAARLLDADEFDRLAIDHARQYPPDSPVLAEYGARFADSTADVTNNMPYLADVARIDRLWTQSHFAADAAAVSAEEITVLAQDALMSLRLALHPATRYAWFPTPAPSIWIGHRDNDDLAEIDVDWQPEGILLTRPGQTVAWRLINAEMSGLLDILARCEAMGDVAVAFLSEYPDADLSDLFAQLLQSGALVAQAIFQKAP